MNIADIPIEGPSGPTTIRGFLVELLRELMRQRGSFCGTAPFGDGGWEFTLYEALVRAGAVKGKFDAAGNLENVDYDQADALLLEVVNGLERN